MNQNKNSQISFDNFEKALSNLDLFLKTPITEARDKAGIIQAFEYSFELCWKTLQKLVVSHNKVVGSPKQAFQAAFELGWIKEIDQDRWIKMSEDRNLTSHTYKEALADEVLGRIKASHLPELQKLLETLRKA
jgi:nucleotidyltransferase substrate binding protein (TIGR01987 family)